MTDFEFTCINWQGSTLNVIKVQGKEAISQPYRFDIILSCPEPIDPDIFLGQVGQFSMRNGIDEPQTYHGIISENQLLAKTHDQYRIQVTLVPRLWALGLGTQSQIFLDRNIPEIITHVLTDLESNGLPLAIDISLTKEYPQHEYVCQFNESALNFISRLMEKTGIYYFFDQKNGTDCLCIRDLSLLHESKNDAELTYASISGLDSIEDELGEPNDKPQLIHTFTEHLQHRTVDVHLRAFDEQKPDVQSDVIHPVADKGFGKTYVYSTQFKRSEDASHLAEICARQLACQLKQYAGKSRATWVEPGYTFALKEHFLGRLNQSYLVTEVHHSAEQSTFLTHGISKNENVDTIHYTNWFTCIPASVHYYSQPNTPIPKITGVLSAVIDGIGNGDSALLDEQGRYKVIMPFDLASDAKGDGKASHWIRLAQPYGGNAQGFHFPLLKGTEVLLTFEEGNPDLPVIQSTIPNAKNQNIVNDQTPYRNTLKTVSGAEIVMDDTPGNQHICLRIGGVSIEMGDIDI
ncbi:type VI secretion system Vgr family protein [Enterovibrio norvegicus]|uniref:Type VI secretion system Vgr family protein n=1 Tax=Enterovibrio norvegicus TaxID=188144 RepID=A0ABV4L5V8_9GAMM|nr:type VI secretion system tip protein TssI/VgrG [Enterovibrio norvegicus]OEF56342.1 VgrG protein [Enterovibrio norvegicus]